MKITVNKTIAFQNVNYNFTMDRINHLDLERLEFELKRFDTFKRNVRNTYKVDINIDNGIYQGHSFSFSPEQVVVGSMEQFLIKLVDMMSVLDNFCSLMSHNGKYDYACISHCIKNLKECLDEKHMILCIEYFDRVSHEYIYHKNKTQKSFYEVYYTDLCNQFENYLKYLENFDTGILNLYFDMCDKFFLHKYEDCKEEGKIL